MPSLHNIEIKLMQLLAEKEVKIADIQRYKKQKVLGQKQQKTIVDARSVVQEAVRATQKSLQLTISKVVTTLLSSITDDPYEFGVDFVDKRNSVECDLSFKRNGKDLSILDSCGHGCADLASLGLKISYRELKKELRPVLILDEPFRQLQKSSHAFVASALKEISKKANLQFLIFTHEKELINHADKAFKVSLKKGVSDVTSL